MQSSILFLKIKLCILTCTLLLMSPFIGYAYERPTHFKPEVWRELSPFFFPKDHPDYQKLKAIFNKRRVTLSLETLKESGFINIKQQPFTKMITAGHEKFPHLFFKIYLDPQKPYKKKPEYQHWLQRIQGSHLIKSLLQKNQWEHFFKVPHKWMFPLPLTPPPPQLFKGVSFILVEENMELLPSKKNLEIWKSIEISTDLLDKLFFILTTLGLKDSVTPKNLPFSIDGKIAFIDTETYRMFPVHTSRLAPYLSRKMRIYWKNIPKNKILNQ